MFHVYVSLSLFPPSSLSKINKTSSDEDLKRKLSMFLLSCPWTETLCQICEQPASSGCVHCHSTDSEAPTQTLTRRDSVYKGLEGGALAYLSTLQTSNQRHRPARGSLWGKTRLGAETEVAWRLLFSSGHSCLSVLPTQPSREEEALHEMETD